MKSIRTSDREGDDRRHHKRPPAEVAPEHDRHERRVKQNEADRVPAGIDQLRRDAFPADCPPEQLEEMGDTAEYTTCGWLHPMNNEGSLA